MHLTCTADLWESLSHTKKTVVMYGMGNGADKILGVCAEKGIAVQDFFASDGFVRGHEFHGKRVLSWSQIKEKYDTKDLIVLLSFGSSRPEVLDTVYRVAEEVELYAPDVPAFGDGLFDRAFFEAHREALERVWELLADEESRLIFENVIAYKLSGDVRFLRQAESDRAKVTEELIDPSAIRVAADLGAYNGDTVRELLDAADGNLQSVYALEPDARNFKKLSAYAQIETRATVHPIHAGAWSKTATLCFDASGNRNASFEKNRSEALSARAFRASATNAVALDEVLDGAEVDYIKYDVEGAEREALIGSEQTIRRCLPILLVSLYHRNEDLFDLPLLIRDRFPAYTRFYLRRFAGVPAWDVNLYVKK
ncbi:MAG: FkbM family methyltransferase [Clostridia bacterium]|nr:FkbM family methyltransferase [Clostridia bacterium]